VFTARYALSPYIKQIRFVFKGLSRVHTTEDTSRAAYVLTASNKRFMRNLQENLCSQTFITMNDIARYRGGKAKSGKWFVFPVLTTYMQTEAGIEVLKLHCKYLHIWDIRFSWMLRSLDWELFAVVSVQSIYAIFRDQVVVLLRVHDAWRWGL
jgi:hypothetical protein